MQAARHCEVRSRRSLRRWLVGLLSGLLPFAFAHAATTIGLSIFSPTTGELLANYEHLCTTDVCSLPNSAPLPIPYPIATIDTTEGVLRGRMRLETASASGEIELRATVSFQTMATINIRPGAPNVLVEGLNSTYRLDVALHNSSTSRLSVPLNPDSGAGVANGVAFGVLDATGALVAEDGFGSSVVAEFNGLVVRDETFLEASSISASAQHRFGLRWVTERVLRLSAGSPGVHILEDDFSHTIGFTGVRFYDSGGNDVTQWIDVTYDQPFAFVSAPVPEPETYAMLLAGLGLLGFAARRRTQKAAALV